MALTTKIAATGSTPSAPNEAIVTLVGGATHQRLQGEEARDHEIAATGSTLSAPNDAIYTLVGGATYP